MGAACTSKDPSHYVHFHHTLPRENLAPLGSSCELAQDRNDGFVVAKQDVGNEHQMTALAIHRLRGLGIKQVGIKALCQPGAGRTANELRLSHLMLPRGL